MDNLLCGLFGVLQEKLGRSLSISDIKVSNSQMATKSQIGEVFVYTPRRERRQAVANSLNTYEIAVQTASQNASFSIVS